MPLHPPRARADADAFAKEVLAGGGRVLSVSTESGGCLVFAVSHSALGGTVRHVLATRGDGMREHHFFLSNALRSAVVLLASGDWAAGVDGGDASLATWLAGRESLALVVDTLARIRRPPGAVAWRVQLRSIGNGRAELVVRGEPGDDSMPLADLLRVHDRLKSVVPPANHVQQAFVFPTAVSIVAKRVFALPDLEEEIAARKQSMVVPAIGHESEEYRPGTSSRRSV